MPLKTFLPNRASALASLLVITSLACLWLFTIPPTQSTKRREPIPRQYQAVLQAASNNYISDRLSNGTASIDEIRREYNATTTQIGHLVLVENFLDSECYLEFLEHSTPTRLQNPVLQQASPPQALSFATWEKGNYPKIGLTEVPEQAVLPTFRSPLSRGPLAVGTATLVCLLLLTIFVHPTYRKPKPEGIPGSPRATQ